MMSLPMSKPTKPKPNPTSKSLHFDQAKRKRGAVKHGILKTFMDGYIPCMSSYFCGDRGELLVYVDGFAGAGKHGSSENGSPLLICDALVAHNTLKKDSSLLMIFTEKSAKTWRKLVKNVGERLERHNSEGGKIEFIYKYRSETFHGKLNEVKSMFREWRVSPEYHLTQCPKVFVIVECGEFKDRMNEVLDVYANNPMLIFVDPFGWTGIPLELIHRILSTSTRNAPKDLFINLMDGNIRRFYDNEGHQDSLRETLGEIRPPPHGPGSGPGPGSSSGSGLHNSGLSSDEKLEHINSEYIRNIKQGYRRDNLMDVKFAMRGKNNGHVYHLIFLCSHKKTLKQMKYSMYRYSENYQEFTFSEYIKKKGQFRDFPQEKNDAALETFERVKEYFDGDFVSGVDIEDYVLLRIPFYFNFKVKLKNLLYEYIPITDPPAKRNSALTRNDYCFIVETQETAAEETIVAENVAINVVNPATGSMDENESTENIANASVRIRDALPTTQRQPRKRKRISETSDAGEPGNQDHQVRVAMKRRNV